MTYEKDGSSGAPPADAVTQNPPAVEQETVRKNALEERET